MSRIVILAALVGALGSPAAAEDAWSGDIALASQYVSKGAGKSGGEPHASIRLERALGTGYAGGWWGTVQTSQGADSEIHLYAGAEREWAGVGLDLRAMYKTLPGTRRGVQEDHLEFRVDASRAFGPNDLRLRIEYAPDGYAAVEQAWWVEGQVSRKLGDRLTASAGAGLREQDNGSDYTAWNIGLRRSLTDALLLDVRWYDTDSHGLGENHEGRLVASAMLGF